MRTAASRTQDHQNHTHHNHGAPPLHPFRRVMAAVRRGFDDATYLNERLFDRPRPW